MARISTEAPAIDVNRIVQGTSLSGELSTNGDIRIDGNVKGTLDVKGKIVLGPNGRIEGEVVCKNAEIQGELNANIKVSELLSLKASAKVQGEINTNKIAIEPGAKISGSINMDKQLGHIKVSKNETELKKENAS